MEAIKIRDLNIQEINEVSGSGPVGNAVIGAGVGWAAEYLRGKIIDWWEAPPSPPTPDGNGIPKNVAKDILDNQKAPSPVPGEESDT